MKKNIFRYGFEEDTLYFNAVLLFFLLILNFVREQYV